VRSCPGILVSPFKGFLHLASFFIFSKPTPSLIKKKLELGQASPWAGPRRECPAKLRWLVGHSPPPTPPLDLIRVQWFTNRQHDWNQDKIAQLNSRTSSRKPCKSVKNTFCECGGRPRPLRKLESTDTPIAPLTPTDSALRPAPCRSLIRRTPPSHCLIAFAGRLAAAPRPLRSCFDVHFPSFRPTFAEPISLAAPGPRPKLDRRNPLRIVFPLPFAHPGCGPRPPAS